ncbi:hypothetical protein LC605_12700 [Nostoc sp. CHAB 5836]|nr:hypothetical protein [Nostoc sp. CHAB 5836]MCC5615914.1 hypothetical protein [Nostoc sp. CHAB 5836]
MLNPTYSNSRCEITAVHCDRIESDVKTFSVLNHTKNIFMARRSHTFNSL